MSAETPQSDAHLLHAVKGGDAPAYGQLYERHVTAARALAGQLVRDETEVEDVVAEAFTRVLDQVGRGGGPESAFRPHLLAVIRRTVHDRTRVRGAPGEIGPSDPTDPVSARLEGSLIAQAYLALPERWRAVLWHTEVENARPADVAPLLGLSANGVAALAYRAREGLRQAYLQIYLTAGPPPECKTVLGKLGAYVRGGLTRRDSRTVDEHVRDCPNCHTVLRELTDVTRGLRTVIGPLVLGATVAGYLEAMSRPAPAPRPFTRRPRLLAAGGAATVMAVAAAFAVVSGQDVGAPPTVAAHPRSSADQYDHVGPYGENRADGSGDSGGGASSGAGDADGGASSGTGVSGGGEPDSSAPHGDGVPSGTDDPEGGDLSGDSARSGGPHGDGVPSGTGDPGRGNLSGDSARSGGLHGGAGDPDGGAPTGAGDPGGGADASAGPGDPHGGAGDPRAAGPGGGDGSRAGVPSGDPPALVPPRESDHVRSRDREGAGSRNRDGGQSRNGEGARSRDREGAGSRNRDGGQSSNREGAGSRNRDGGQSRNRDGAGSHDRDGERSHLPRGNSDGERRRPTREQAGASGRDDRRAGRARLRASVTVMGSLVRGEQGIVAMRVRNTGTAPTRDVYAAIELPEGVTLASRTSPIAEAPWSAPKKPGAIQWAGSTGEGGTDRRDTSGAALTALVPAEAPVFQHSGTTGTPTQSSPPAGQEARSAGGRNPAVPSEQSVEGWSAAAPAGQEVRSVGGWNPAAPGRQQVWSVGGWNPAVPGGLQAWSVGGWSAAAPGEVRSVGDRRPAGQGTDASWNAVVPGESGAVQWTGNERSGSGWRCRTVRGGARCAREPLAAGRVSSVFLRVKVAGDAPVGAGPRLRVESGTLRLSARARAGVRASGATARFAADGKVTVRAVGNGLLTCRSRRDGCAGAKRRDGRLRPLDADRSGDTDASSAARLSLPEGGRILWAGLYWSATAEDAGPIRVKPPGRGRYVTVRPSRVEWQELPDGPAYQAFADVTGLAASAGRGGAWWAADPPMGGSGHAGWSLVVVAADPDAPYGHAVVLDDARVIGSDSPALRLPLGGLERAAGPARVELVAWEGDAGLRGDRVSLGSGPVAPEGGDRDAGNAFDGSANGTRGMTLGVDVDTLSHALGARPRLTITGKRDVVLFGVAAVSVRARP